jgi:hypothetical protein
VRDGFDRVRDGIADAKEVDWENPDMEVLRLHRRKPPLLPIEVFDGRWRSWIEEAAKAAACPSDYVVGPLLASVSC